jgi:antitoxin component YwqK of YwqJK toxin-antitoxin module
MMMRKIKLLTVLLLICPLLIVAQNINQTDGNGLKQGKWTKTYANGIPRYEGQFKNDKPYGEFKNYYISGVLKAVTKYSPDGIIARTKTFHENSLPMASGKYINQIKDSVWNYYSDTDGKLISQESYKNNKLEGKSITFYPDNGKIAESIDYINGKKEGELRKYFPEGNIMTEGTYVNDQLEGDFTLYFPNGNIQIKGKYKDGRQIGNWSYFDEEGKEVSEDDFKESNN